MKTTLPRRSVLGGAAAMLAMPAMPRAQAWRKELVFDVVRGGKSIGSHALTFRRRGDDLVVNVTIDLVVEIAWIPVFRYEHRNREVWRSGRLLALESRTSDDGGKHRVHARNDGERLVVEGDDGVIDARADLLTTSYWHPGTPQSSQLLDTQKGRIVDVEHRSAGIGDLEVAGRTLEARRYDASGDLEFSIWYSLDRVWCGLEFDARGKRVRYRAVAWPDGESWLPVAELVGA